MTIPFKNIPSNIRTPFFFGEIDPSHANTATLNQRALIIGQLTAAGTGAVNIPVISQGVADAKNQYGQGSHLAQMMYTYRQNDTFGEVWCLPLADDPASVAATATITFTQVNMAVGVLSLYVGGMLVSTMLTTGQTLTQIAATVAASINSINDLAVTATATAGVVSLAAKNKGLTGNDIDIRVNYLGLAGGQTTPVGLVLSITPMSGGLVNPNLSSGLANLMDLPFDFIVMPYTDTASLNALQSFLSDTTGRWSWSSQIYGGLFVAYRGTFAALGTFGTTRNDQHASCMGFYDSPTPNWKWAAALGAQAAISVRADPGVPLQTLILNDVLAPPIQSRNELSERNTLLYDGISTFTVNTANQVCIENVITTYQTNAFGQPDNSYLQVEDMYLLMYVLRRQQSVFTTKYSRVKLAANGTRFAPGANIVTPDTIRADLIADYQAMEYEGYVQNAPAFAAALIVQQNASNPMRVDILYPATLIDQLRIVALLLQFTLQ